MHHPTDRITHTTAFVTPVVPLFVYRMYYTMTIVMHLSSKDTSLWGGYTDYVSLPDMDTLWKTFLLVLQVPTGTDPRSTAHLATFVPVETILFRVVSSFSLYF